MEKPDLETAAEAKSEEEQLMELGYKINNANSVEELAEVVYDSGEVAKIEAFNAERLHQLKEIDKEGNTNVMEKYDEHCDAEGFLTIDGVKAEHVTAIDTIVADNAAGLLEGLKESVIKAEDSPEQETGE